MKTTYKIKIEYHGEIEGVASAESLEAAVEIIRRQREPDEMPDFVFHKITSSKIVAAMPNQRIARRSRKTLL